MEEKTILIVEDDLATLNILKTIYSNAGINVITSYDGSSGLQKFSEHQPDAIILDLMLPNINGWTVCRQVRQTTDIPIIILSALGSEEDKQDAIKNGATDYITKPFSTQNLVKRTKELLIEADSIDNQASIYDDGYLRFDPTDYQLFINGQFVRLTKTEGKLLELLIRQKDMLQTYNQILQHVWGWNHNGKPEKIQLNISRLRQKIEPDPQDPTYLILEYGLGYIFHSKQH